MRQATLVAALAAGAVVAPAGAALAQGPSRQTATVVFSEKATSSPTGATVKIRYRAPADAAGKPPAVQKIVTTFAPGTTVDTAVPAVCGASDARLMAEGVEACPAQSVVGGGAVTLDTGVEGQRFVENELALLNNTGELIMLTTVRGSSPPTRAVVRGKIVGNTIVSEIPPIPGGGSDGFTAIRDVDFKVSPIVNRAGGEARAYLTTPASCPSTGVFANSFTFAYRDGVTQEVPSPSACTQLDRTPPRIKLAGVPRNRCVKRGTRARIRVLDSSELRVGVRLNGRRVVVTRLKRVVVRLRRPALRRGRNRLTITARDAAGNRARLTRRFVRCR
ncbi:MAG: hypothetical protein H0U25_04630 [Thermoleophilaceae bacterium]|nr:hypothetical protein [Thermoleophilaceae bacterium]